MKLLSSVAAGLLSAGLAHAASISTDGTCAGTNGYTCVGSTFGNCCSQYGWCGNTDAHCGSGCNGAFGTCPGSNPSPSTLPSSATAPSSAPPASTSTSSTSASQCLNAKNVPYKLASDSEYAGLVKPYNLRLPYNPAVVVVPTTNQHVQDAVLCAAQNGLKVQAKSGGHSYANFGDGGQDGSLIVNLESLQDIQLDKTTGIATVGGGVRLGNLADGIYTQNNAALSHGTCPGVGIGGHFTHGGYSHTSRNWGLAMDQIIAADVVLANGTLVKATSDQSPDIFWAIRGAAESFGIVTTFYLQTRPAPDSVTYFQVSLPAAWNSQSAFTNTFLHLQDVATNASVVDNRISFGMYLDGSGTFSLSGAFFGTVDEFNTRIKPELVRTLPVSTEPTVKSYGWYDFLVLESGETTLKVPLQGYDEHENFFAKSITVPEKDGLTADSLNAFYDYVKQGTTVNFYVIINLYGGPGSAINSKDTNFAAYADRDSLWVFQNWGYATAGDAVSFINGLNSAVINAQPQTNFGAYLNYVDASLSAAEAHKLYYGDELYAKLLALKKQVDPESVFWNPQAIGA